MMEKIIHAKTKMSYEHVNMSHEQLHALTMDILSA